MQLRQSPCSLDLINEAVQAIESGRSESFALVIRGPRETAQARQAVLSEIGLSAAFALPIYTLDQLVAHLMHRLDISPVAKAGDIQRELLAAEAISRCAANGELVQLANGAQRSGMAKSLAQVFMWLDEAGIDGCMLETILSDGASANGRDLVKVWRSYESLLHSIGCEENMRHYAVVAERLRQQANSRRLVGLRTVRVSGCLWFSGCEELLLSALASCGVDVQIEMRCASGHDGRCVEAVQRAVAPARVKCIELEPSAMTPRLLAAAGPLREAREVAREIKRLVVHEKVSPAQICVASADSSEFVPALLESLEEFQVPTATPRRRLMVESSLIMDCIELARLLSSGDRKLDIMPLMSSPYLGLGPQVAGEMRHALKLEGLELTLRGWERRFGRCDPSGRGKNYVSVLMNALDHGEEVRSACEGAELARCVQGFGAALAHLGMVNRIGTLQQGADEHPISEWSAWSALNHLLLEISIAQGTDATAPCESGGGWIQFLSVLSSAAARRRSTLGRSSPNGVSVLSLERAAVQNHEFLFISGLGEQVLPRRRPRPWILQDGDVAALINAGIELEPMGNGAEADRYAFNCLVNSATGRLYLTYATSKEDGSAARRSFLVDEYLASIGILGDREREVTTVAPASQVFPMDWASVASTSEARISALWSQGRQAKAAASADAESVWWLDSHDDAFARLKHAWIERGGTDACGARSEFCGRIGDTQLLTALGDEFLEGRPWSTQSLGQYMACPFSFFCKWVLQINTRDEVIEEVDARDRGTCLHEIAKRFLGAHVGEVLVPSREAEYVDEIRRIAASVVGEMSPERSGLTQATWDACCGGIVRSSWEFVARELEFSAATSGAWRPAYLEWPFGSKQAPVTIGQNQIPVYGRVDRIDVGPGGALAIYDYKSGSTVPKAKDIREVKDIQLGLYALVAQKVLGSEVAGIWYYQIPMKGRTEGVWRRAYHDAFNAGGKRSGKLDEGEWQELMSRVEEAVTACDDGVRSGVFDPTPSDEACRYCDYVDICRMLDSGGTELSEEGGGQGE